MITPINQIQYLSAGAKLDAVEGVLTAIYEDVKRGDNAHGPWSIQKAKLKGPDGHEIELKFMNMETVGANCKGIAVRFSKGSDPKAKSISVEEYKGKKNLAINGTAVWDWRPADYGTTTAGGSHAQQGPPPQQGYQPGYQQGPPPQHQGPPPQQQTQRNAPPPQHNPPPPQTQRQANPPPRREDERIPIHGATCGMALKAALDLAIANPTRWPDVHSQDFLMELYQKASDFVRISQRMESGILAKPLKDRLAKAGQTAPPSGEGHVEPDYSHEPPLNARERAEAERRAAGQYQPPHDDDRHYEPDPEHSRPAPMEDDNIPF